MALLGTPLQLAAGEREVSSQRVCARSYVTLLVVAATGAEGAGYTTCKEVIIIMQLYVVCCDVV